jgi:hypothetical protein
MNRGWCFSAGFPGSASASDAGDPAVLEDDLNRLLVSRNQEGAIRQDLFISIFDVKQ